MYEWGEVKKVLGNKIGLRFILEHCVQWAEKSGIDKINNIARYNLIDTKYQQMAFRLARWCCNHALFGNPWSNKSEWWLSEEDIPWNLLFSSRIEIQIIAVHEKRQPDKQEIFELNFLKKSYKNSILHQSMKEEWRNTLLFFMRENFPRKIHRNWI